MGSVIGFGLREILTLTSTGWFVLSAEGRLDNEEVWMLRALLYGTRTSASPLSASDLLEGIHVTAIDMGDEVMLFKGVFSGTLEGDVVPSGTIGVIRLEGAGTFRLVGYRAEAAALADIPLDDPSLPEDVFGEIRGLTELLHD